MPDANQLIKNTQQSYIDSGVIKPTSNYTNVGPGYETPAGLTLNQLTQQMGATPMWTDEGSIGNLPNGNLRPLDQIKFKTPDGRIFQYQKTTPFDTGFSSAGTFAQVGQTSEPKPAQQPQYSGTPMVNAGQGFVPYQPQLYTPQKSQPQVTQPNAPIPARSGQSFMTPAPTTPMPQFTPSSGVGTKSGGWTFTGGGQFGWEWQGTDFKKEQETIKKAIETSNADITNGSEVRLASKEASEVSANLPDAGVAYPSPASISSPQYNTASVVQESWNEMKKLISDWTAYINYGKGNLQSAYQNLLSSNQGPTGESAMSLQQQLLGIKDVMNATDDDIRKELQAGGGMVTESQVQALVSTRNSVLEKKAQTISDMLTVQTNYVNQMMQYYQYDQQEAEKKFETQFNLQSKIYEWQKQAENTEFSQTMQYQNFLDGEANKAWNVIKQISATPNATISSSQADWISNLFNQSGVPITKEQIVQFANDKSQQAANQAQAQYYRLLGAQVNASTNAQNRTDEVNNFLDSKKGTDGYVSASDYQSALQKWIASKGTQSNFFASFPQSNYLSQGEIGKLPAALRPQQIVDKKDLSIDEVSIINDAKAKLDQVKQRYGDVEGTRQQIIDYAKQNYNIDLSPYI